MSRIGKKEITVPKGVDIKLDSSMIVVKGKLGALQRGLHQNISIKHSKNQIGVTALKKDRKTKALWGMYRSLINNMIIGVTNGFSKVLLVNGVGYRALVKGKSLSLSLGHSHPINYPIPEGIKIEVDKKGTTITVSGYDKEKVGKVCADIRKFRSPEPYKGKGVRYSDEVVLRKEGKKK